MNLAFVVGCSEYQDPIPSLKYAARDAERFATTLRDTCGLSSAEITLLYDGSNDSLRPEYTRVLRALSGGRRSVADGIRVDILYFFFSGHGYHSELTGEDYLLVADSVADDLDQTALSVTGILRRLQEWKPRHLVFFLDACRESLGQGKAYSPDELAVPDVNALLPPGHVTFCSCSAEERSYESDAISSGLFTEALCEALSDKGRCRTLHELNAYIGKRVPELSSVVGKPRQTPAARLEPPEVLALEIVSAQKRNFWRANIPIGSERRRRSVPRNDAGDAIAIDFGTCNSLIGRLHPSRGFEVIPEPSGRGLVPSVVNFTPDLDYVVGWDAVEADRTRPEGTIRHVKRALGTSKQYQIYDRSLTPEFVTSLILRSLKANAEEYLGTAMPRVVTGYPASFSISQLNALAIAFDLAGIDVGRFVGEPSAASFLLPGSVDEKTGKGLVIDMGGGTLDVSVVDYGDGVFEVEGTAGNGMLGGVDYDQILVDYLTERITEMIDRPAPLPTYMTAEIRREAERAKHALTYAHECLIVLRDVELALGDTRDLHIVLDRRTFSALTAHLNAEVVETIRRAIREVEDAYYQAAKRQGRKIESPEPMPPPDFTMLAGQGTKIPGLRETIHGLNESEIIARHQDDAVLRGLAVQAGVLKGLSKDRLLLDVVYRSIGFMLHRVPEDDPDDYLLYLESDDNQNNLAYVLLEKGTTIPTKLSDIITAPAGGDPIRRLRVMEYGRRGIDSEAIPIGVVEIDSRREETQLQLTIDIDTNGIILLEIFDMTHSDRRKILLNSISRMTGVELITEQRLTGTLGEAPSSL